MYGRNFPNTFKTKVRVITPHYTFELTVLKFHVSPKTVYYSPKNGILFPQGRYTIPPIW